MSCEHTEGMYESQGVRSVHDCAYVDRRNAFIPAAERFALSKAGPERVGESAIRAWEGEFNRAFHWAMRELMDGRKVQ